KKASKTSSRTFSYNKFLKRKTMQTPMPTPTDNASLERAIKELELMQSVQKNDLRVHFEQTKEALNPANLFKDGVKEAFHNSSFQTTAAKSLLSLAFGYFTKK